jgi:tetratricopeptide (TPR) repeat protein
MQRRLIVVLVLATLLVPALALAGAKEDVMRGLEAGRRGAYLVAVKLITEAIASGELDKYQTGLAYKALGITRLDKGEYKKAVNAFTTALDYVPGDPDALYHRAQAFEKLDKPVDARADLVMAVGAFFDRGVVYMDHDELESALADFNRAIELNPGVAKYYTFRGMVLNRMDKPKDAIENFNTAIDLDPNDPMAFLNRGNAWKQRGSFENTVFDYTKAIELDPKYAAAYFNRGLIWGRIANHEEAAKDFSKVIELDPMDWAAYYRRGQARLAMGKERKARKDFETAHELNPAQPMPEPFAENATEPVTSAAP